MNKKRAFIIVSILILFLIPKSYKVVSKETDNYFLFNKTEIELQITDSGFTFVEGIGVLGVFIPFIYKPYFEK